MNIHESLEGEQKYELMYWKKVHECKRLKQLLRDHGICMDDGHDKVCDRNESYTGHIFKLSHSCDYGFIQCNINSNLFLHVSECRNFELNQTMVNKEVQFKIDQKRGKLQAIDVHHFIKNKAENTSELLDMLDNHTQFPPLDSNITTIEEPLPQGSNDHIQSSNDHIQNINSAKNVWYMNGHERSMIYWKALIRNGFVVTWNKDKRNKNIFHKLIKDDIVAWYIRGKGFIAILKVIDPPGMITDNELDALTSSKNVYSSGDRVWWKECGIKIPVSFLTHVKPDQCVNRSDIPSITKWTYGLRGSCCMKPSSDEWKQQVIEMYKYMESI